MTERADASPQAVIGRLLDAINQHDIEVFLACFASDYHSERPFHPHDETRGREQVRQRWSRTFSDVPNIRAELLRSTFNADTAWTEWRWSGTWANGTPFGLGGVAIFGIDGGMIQWGRLYIETTIGGPGTFAM